MAQTLYDDFMEGKLSTQYNEAVQQIKTAILRSQAKALSGVNQEQLALYYGIGRYVSYNTREGYWGKGAIATISAQLRAELPGIRGGAYAQIISSFKTTSTFISSVGVL